MKNPLNFPKENDIPFKIIMFSSKSAHMERPNKCSLKTAGAGSGVQPAHDSYRYSENERASARS